MSVTGRRLLLPSVVVVLLLAIVALPTGRASAQAFLDLFRVTHVAAVPVNMDRLNQLTQRGLDISSMIGSQVEVLADPGPAQVYSSPAVAASAAGYAVWLQSGVRTWHTRSLKSVAGSIGSSRVTR